MSFYARWIFPWLLDLGMRNKEARRFRERVIPQATGRVLEIGAMSEKDRVRISGRFGA